MSCKTPCGEIQVLAVAMPWGFKSPFRTNLFLKPSDLSVFNPESDTW